MRQHYKFKNIPLPYSFDAMEPYIDAKTMEIHHDKHLQSYINNLNKTLEDYPELHDLTLEQLICSVDMFPYEIQKSIKHNAGGVFNHNFYFSELKNSGSKEPSGKLAEAINTTFGSYLEFVKELKRMALSVFGSGYVWLTLDNDKHLKIVKTVNQDTPLTKNLKPILNIDVWEHAYYLKHYNKRSDYIDDWFNIIDWDKASQIYFKHMLQ